MNTADMLKRRESQIGCKGGFSQAQCCHLASFHYLPSRATRVIDRMQSRVYIGNFSAEGNVFVGNFHGFQFAHTLLTGLVAKPYRPPCHQHPGDPLQKPVQHFLQCSVLELLLNIHGRPCCATCDKRSRSVKDMPSSNGCYQTCPSARIHSDTPSGHLAETGSTCDCH